MQAFELPTAINPKMQQSNSCMVDVEIESNETVILTTTYLRTFKVFLNASTISRVGQVCDSNTQLDFSHSGPTTENTKTVIQIPKVKQGIKHQLSGSKTWIKAQVHSMAGKSTGEYKYHLNLLNDGEKDPVGLNFENQIKAWQPCSNDNLAEKEKKKEETQGIFISSAFPKQKVIEAKECELQSWLENDVYDVVPYAGQKLMSVKSVFFLRKMLMTNQ